MIQKGSKILLLKFPTDESYRYNQKNPVFSILHQKAGLGKI